MKGISVFAKMSASVLITLLILTVLIMFAGTGIYIAAFISVGGFIMFGVSGLVFWFAVNCGLNKITKYNSVSVFISAIVASLLSGFTFEFVRANFLVYEFKDVFSTKLLIMPIAILSALIYVLLFSTKRPPA
ncbi:hypothetical protein [Cellvibrio fibrivorans]|uniref:Uncharacterized protein n=1 Tax=Cellvibrio fibrivorans TaxID=126350 RepID=A0ABU1V403_9GAMM|nr:hypothetical protein [Cellvibrio fibrivorans]MDR7092199.1 hypothetical protein [Cellvibrio fibrivorans]